MGLKVKSYKPIRIITVLVLVINLLILSGCNSTNGSLAESDGKNDSSSQSGATGLSIGFGKVDITPETPIQLRGQNYDRVATSVKDPLYATAVAMESDDSTMQAVIVSVDNIIVDSWGLIEAVRKYTDGKMEGFKDTTNILCFATHTHTGPWSYTSEYFPPPGNVAMSGDDYQKWMASKVGDAAISAWNDRKSGAVSSIVGQSETGWCRIARFNNGKDTMYGDPNLSTFVEFISGNDHHLNLLYCYQGDELKGVMLNPTFPFQSCETETEISADITGRIRERFPELYILPIISAAGDMSPYNTEKGSIGSQMGFANRDKYGDIISDEIEKYIKNGVAKEKREKKLVTEHLVKEIKVERTLQYGGSKLSVELHALRLGKTVLVNNPFELYLDYGLAIKAESTAEVTWIGQLSSNPYNYAGDCLYLPSKFAEEGGAYGAASSQVGSAGGAQLVKETTALINEIMKSGTTEVYDCVARSDNIVTKGSCTEEHDAGAYGRSRTVMKEKGAEISFTFNGTGVKWYDSAGSDKGIAQIYIDGELYGETDAYNSILLYQHEMLRITGLKDGEHTVKIVCTGKKSEASLDCKVGADFFVTIKQ